MTPCAPLTPIPAAPPSFPQDDSAGGSSPMPARAPIHERPGNPGPVGGASHHPLDALPANWMDALSAWNSQAIAMHTGEQIRKDARDDD